MKNNSDLFFTCSLIEYIGRTQKLKRKEVVQYLGEESLRRIYKYASTLHCEPMEKVAYDYIDLRKIPMGKYDNVMACKYEVPDYWTIGEVYERLIEDIVVDDVITSLLNVYDSWISDAISNYNSDFFYQSRDYIFACYEEGTIL